MNANEIYIGAEYAFKTSKYGSINKGVIMGKGLPREGVKAKDGVKVGMDYEYADGDGKIVKTLRTYSVPSRWIEKPWVEYAAEQKALADERERKRKEHEAATKAARDKNTAIYEKFKALLGDDFKLARSVYSDPIPVSQWYDTQDSSKKNYIPESDYTMRVSIPFEDLVKVLERAASKAAGK